MKPIVKKLKAFQKMNTQFILKKQERNDKKFIKRLKKEEKQFKQNMKIACEVASEIFPWFTTFNSFFTSFER